MKHTATFKYHNKRNCSNEDDDEAITKNCNKNRASGAGRDGMRQDRPAKWDWKLRMKSNLHRYVKAKHTKSDLLRLLVIFRFLFSFRCCSLFTCGWTELEFFFILVSLVIFLFLQIFTCHCRHMCVWFDCHWLGCAFCFQIIKESAHFNY